jgi:predicted MFS family arabinose efflux permease
MPLSLDAATRLILVLGLGAGSSSLAGRALDPLVGVISGEFAVPVATVALLSTAFALPYALVQPILGPIGDALGKQRVIRVALVLLAVALFACAFAPDFVSLWVLRALSGAAAGGIFPLAIAVVGDQVPLEKRQVALARLIVAGLTGSTLGGALAALTEPLIGWRGVLMLCAIVPLLGLPLLRDDGAGQQRRFRLAEALERYRYILSQKAARALYAAVFIEGILFFGIFPFLAPLFVERGQAAGNGAAEAGMAIAGFAVGGFIFATLAPVLLGRFGQVRLVAGGGSVAAIGLSAIAFAPAAFVAIGGMLFVGLGFYMIHSAIQTRVTEVAPGARGSAVALHAFSFFLGQSIGPVVMGAARALVGPVGGLLAAAAGLIVLSLWLAPKGRAKG